mgnify:CR=1 FL=1
MSRVLVEQLVNRFEAIGQERIQGLPIYNDKLKVEAVDFQPCENGQIGGLVTPWFINIMLLPDNCDSLQFKELGDKIKCDLPSGKCEFSIGEEDVLGRYLFRSVVSPTHCYKTQEPACSVVRKALKKLMTTPAEREPDNADKDQPDQARRDFLRGIQRTTEIA